MSKIDSLFIQIDAFILKYYKNQILKGFLIFGSILLFAFLCITIFEYFFHLSVIYRAVLFYGFLCLNISVFVYYFLIPILKIFSIGKKISRIKAAQMIGDLIPEIEDKLLNTIQLNNDKSNNIIAINIISASLEKRSEQLNYIPFKKAINFKENIKYLKVFFPVFFVFSSIVLFSPSWLLIGSKRILNYSKEFVAPAPFKFVLINKNLYCDEGEDYDVILDLVGTDLPKKVYIVTQRGKILMDKKNKTKYYFRIQKPKQKEFFYFSAQGFESKKYNLNVIGKTSITNLNANLTYPDYLEKKKEKINNVGNLLVPEGTIVDWDLSSKNTKWLEFVFNNEKTKFTSNKISTKKKILEESKISWILKNKFNNKQDTTSFEIAMIKDLYPFISVNQTKDSLKEGVFLFNGKISDDYGLKSLTFVYNHVSDSKNKTKSLKVKPVSGTQLSFYFAVNFKELKLKLNDKIEYYFVVKDNDGVNGSKSTKSIKYVYKLPNLSSLNDLRETENKEIKKRMNELINKTNEFKKKIKKLKSDNLKTKSNSWKQLNKTAELLKEEKSITKEIEDLNKEMKESLKNKNELSEQDKELLEKQKLLEQLMDKLIDKELEKMLEELMELMKKNEKEASQQELEKIEENTDELNKQLDRSLEILKRMQVNEKIDDIEKELKELAKKQDELKEKTEENKNNNEQKAEDQEKLNKEFNKIEKSLDSLQKMNEELKNPMQIEKTKEEQKEINDEMNSSKESIEKNKNKKASKSQKSASSKMKELAEKLNDMQQESNQQQQQEDINSLKNILESLMTLSFDQEGLMKDFYNISSNDPQYRKKGREQRKIIDETKKVKDSLLALAMRNPKIASFIDQEITNLKKHHEICLEAIDERKNTITRHQQFAMTSYNNLSLMLNESLEQMQNEMQNMQPGSGKCNKPGQKGKPKPGMGENMSLQQMKKMLQQQLEQLKKGSNPNGKKPGGQKMKLPGVGGNKGLAKMAAEQSQIRKQLEQLRNKLNEDGKGSGNKLNPLLKELEKQQKEIINKNLSNELIERQNRILTRLLENEKAIRERGYDEKRESKEGNYINNGNKIRFDEYTKEKKKQIELLRSADPSYKKYYKDKANQYFNEY